MTNNGAGPALVADGHVGLLGKTSPANAGIYIGTGTGSLNDAGGDQANKTMGIKVKVDTPNDGTTPEQDGAHVNVNVVEGGVGGSVNAFVARADMNSTSGTGPVVGLWGDCLVKANSARPAFGGNIYCRIDPSAEGYDSGAVGCEIGLHNRTNVVNGGTSLHLVNHGEGANIRSLLMMNSEGEGSQAQHSILASSNALKGPAINFVYYGPLASGNVPTGTPLFKIDATGSTSMNGNLTLTNGASNGFVEMSEQSSDPPAPGANKARLFLRDNGSGKTQLCVRFNTGATQVLASQP